MSWTKQFTNCKLSPAICQHRSQAGQKIITIKGISAPNFIVVYAIIANWKNRTLSAALPFFSSKINLRRCAQDLRRTGYHVAFRRISAASQAA